MRKLLFIIACLPSLALADVAHTYEVVESPFIGWSNYTGFSAGLDSKFRFGLDPHWQLEAGFGFFTNKHGSHRDYSVGVNYNFEEDWSRSWYVGAGLGYMEGTLYNYSNSNFSNDSRTYTYVSGGRRFRLNDSGSFTWNPYVELTAADHTRATINIVPLSFAYSF